MMGLLFLFGLASSGVNAPTVAGFHSVTRKDLNFYQLDESHLFIKTRNCYHLSYRDRAVITYYAAWDSRNTISFLDNRDKQRAKCRVDILVVEIRP
jgi:hypothetical protein